MNTLLFTCILTVLISCSGQNAPHEANNAIRDQHVATSIGDTVQQLDKSIMTIYQDKKKNYWFGSWVDGVYQYDGKTLLHFTTEDGLCQNKIVSIQEDTAGNMFFNTDVGISKFDGQVFTTLRTAGNAWKLQSGDLWFTGAQDSGVVYRYDGDILHRLEFPKTKPGDAFISKYPRSKHPNMTFSPYDVYTIYNDSKGSVWFGTSSLGVCRYDGNTFTWLSETDLAFDVETAFGIRSIIEDNDGKFWFSNTLHRFKMLEDGNYLKEKGIDGHDSKTHFDMIALISMAKDNDDLWMVYHSGVWRYNGHSLV